ncbi:MAG: mucoidy inhibitor MuiA family protein [Polyangiaceae bacterium]|nr:mucoidy inhibitor MuiA family protein [Polyangiaceae bacterium]
MSATRSIRQLAFFCAVGWLSLAAGCAQTGSTAKPAATAAGPGAAAGGLDPSVPQARLVADDPNAVPVSSSIRKVTVYSDRALVSREATVKLTTAPTVYAVRHLPGWVDEGSVRAATTAGRILDVRVGRSYLARASEQSYRKAEADVRALAERLLALDDELKVLDAQTKQIEDIKAFSLDKLHKDVAAGSAPAAGQAVVPGSVGVSTYAAVVDFIAQKMREIAKGRRSVKAEREKLAPVVDASKRRLEDLRGLTQLEETNVFVTVQGIAAADGQVQVSYMLPGATWEASHELRASGGDSTPVEVTSFAVVTQASGEDWDNAELTFSTQSSTAAVRIPELEALTLGDGRAHTRTVERHSASFRRAEAAFKGQNRLWNKRVQSTDRSIEFEESYQANFESLQVTQEKTVQIFQSLQQRGTTAQFKAMSTTKVRADGRSVRVPLGRANLKAKKAVVAAPEQSLNAAQTLEMVNDSGQSLLPGNVALYQAGAFLGMTNLDFVADGEEFAVFLSVADQLKLSRVLDKKRSALVRKQRTQMQLAFVVTIENLSGKPVSLKLADRVPVSEDKDIVISGVKISPEVKPDSKGILRWPLTLQPKEKRKLEIQYQIEYPPTLVLEARRKAAAEASPMKAHPSAPALPSPRRAYDLKKDIEELENAF